MTGALDPNTGRYAMGGGVGFFDCDIDGRLDIVVTNGSSVDRYRAGGDLMVTLYRQGADGKFNNITERAGLNVKGWGMGVAVADFDNDGNLDLFVTGYGHSVLYRGLGNCKFEDIGLDDLNARVLAYTEDHAYELFGLPHHHPDPFDGQFIAHAEDLPLVTCDKQFRLCGGLRVIW